MPATFATARDSLRSSQPITDLAGTLRAGISRPSNLPVTFMPRRAPDVELRYMLENMLLSVLTNSDLWRWSSCGIRMKSTPSSLPSPISALDSFPPLAVEHEPHRDALFTVAGKATIAAMKLNAADGERDFPVVAQGPFTCLVGDEPEPKGNRMASIRQGSPRARRTWLCSEPLHEGENRDRTRQGLSETNDELAMGIRVLQRAVSSVGVSRERFNVSGVIASALYCDAAGFSSGFRCQAKHYPLSPVCRAW